MWIIPKNISDTCPFVVDTKESELDLEKFSQMCERSLMWRSKPSPSATWLRRWKRLKYIQHLYSRTLKSSHSESFVDAWTSYLGDSPASRSQQRESEMELKTQDTSSPTSLKESESANQQQYFWRMSKGSSVAKQQTEDPFLNMCSKAWKKWVTQQRQEYLVRLKSGLPTKENESSSWPTARTSDAEGGRIKTEMTEKGFRSRREKSDQWFGAKLRDAVETHEETWPTPTSRDWKDGSNVPPSRMDPCKQTLGQRMAYLNQENWPTPTVAEGGKIGNNPNYGQLALSNHPQVHGYERTREKLIKSGKEIDGPQDHTNNSTNGKLRGQLLNPAWVEQLMGLPLNWTQLPTEWID